MGFLTSPSKPPSSSFQNSVLSKLEVAVVQTDSEIFPGKASSLIRESHDYLQWPFEPGPLVMLLAEVSPGF